jgi:hypothetical protein
MFQTEENPMKLRTTLIATSLVTAGLVSGAAQAALHQRATSEAPTMVYDDVLDVTWGVRYGYSDWQDAVNNAAINTWGGGTNWRLPTINELTSLYNLNADYSQADYLLNLPNVGVGIYWSGEELNADEAWFVVLGPSLEYYPETGLYTYNSGSAYTATKIGGLGAMAVIEVMSGDIAAVPEPETYAMLLAGLGLVGAAVKRQRRDCLH